MLVAESNTSVFSCCRAVAFFPGVTRRSSLHDAPKSTLSELLREVGRTPWELTRVAATRAAGVATKRSPRSQKKTRPHN